MSDLEKKEEIKPEQQELGRETLSSLALFHLETVQRTLKESEDALKKEEDLLDSLSDVSKDLSLIGSELGGVKSDLLTLIQEFDKNLEAELKPDGENLKKAYQEVDKILSNRDTFKEAAKFEAKESVDEVSEPIKAFSDSPKSNTSVDIKIPVQKPKKATLEEQVASENVEESSEKNKSLDSAENKIALSNNTPSQLSQIIEEMFQAESDRISNEEDPDSKNGKIVTIGVAIMMSAVVLLTLLYKIL